MLDFLYNNIKEIAAVITIIVTACTIIGAVLKRRSRINNWRNKEIIKLGEIGDTSTLNLVKSRRFIKTMGQEEPPHEDEIIFCSPNRYSLIDEMLKEILKKDTINKKRYMIMGGSGMGKSTFSAALFYKYIQKVKSKKNPSSIFIKSLCNPNVLEDILDLCRANIEQSILILDALDENIEAANDISAFMDKLENATRGFRIVIITCRTQFFENEDREPNKLKIRITGASKKSLEYEKIFISPFTQKEAKKYLRKKFGFINKEYYKAVKIAEKCWDVLSRPMVLSFIDDLMELDEINNIQTVEIYSKIIDKWFEREIDFQEIEKKDLFTFSKEIAQFMYYKWNESRSPFISADEYMSFLKSHGFEKSPYSFRARSLINRTSSGAIKFAHKSFWEFFLAINALENPNHPYPQKGLEMAVTFSKELSFFICEKNKKICVPLDDYMINFNNGVGQMKLIETYDDMFMLYDGCKDCYLRESEEFNLFMCYLWESSISSMITVYNELFKDNNDNDNNNKKKKKNLKELYFLNKRLLFDLSSILSCKNNSKRHLRINRMILVYQSIKDLQRESGVYRLYEESSVKIKTIVPYPMLNSQIGYQIGEFLGNIGLGRGFFDLIDRVKFLEKALVRFDSKLLFVFINAKENLNELYTVITSLYGTQSSSVVIFVISFKETTIYYYLDLAQKNRYGAKKIKTILDTLYSVKCSME